MDDKKIMNRLQEQLEEVRQVYPDNDWFGIFLAGSQNYGMADDESDIDSKCWLMPSLEQLVLNKPAISKTHIMANNEHVDCKDIREYFKILRKQNVNFMEVLFTDYFIINPKYFDLWTDLQIHREQIARSNIYRFLKCCNGMIQQKNAAFDHPYPSKKEILEKYGYDPKQLSHIIRIYLFMIDFVFFQNSYKDCLCSNQSDYLLSVKRGLYNYTDACKVKNEYLKLTEEFISQYSGKYQDNLDTAVDSLLDNILYEAVCKCLDIKDSWACLNNKCMFIL